VISLDPAIWQCFVVAFQKTAKNGTEYGMEHTEPRRTPDSDFVFPGYDFVCSLFFFVDILFAMFVRIVPNLLLMRPLLV